MTSANPPIPLRNRKYDGIFVLFFLVNICFITYIVDIEQLTVPNPYHFHPPAWPPLFFIHMVHHCGAMYDPDLMARPEWWKATIWIDVLCFGPFSVFVIYAFWRGRNWIRIPSIMYSSVMLTNVTIIMFEEMAGRTPTPHPLVVWAVNIPGFYCRSDFGADDPERYPLHAQRASSMVDFQQSTDRGRWDKGMDVGIVIYNAVVAPEQ